MASLKQTIQTHLQNLDEHQVIALLEKCKETIRSLNLVLSVKHRQKHFLEQRITALRSRTSSINRMPDEIMLEIFQEVKRDASLALGPILLVCQKWYQLAIDSPFLWASIVVDLEEAFHAPMIKSGQQYVEAAIRYSRQAPLSVDITLPNPYHVVRQTSYDLLGLDDWELRIDNNQAHYNTVYEWIKEALMSDALASALYRDITNAISKFTVTIAGSNGENLLRMRSFRVNYDPDHFKDWLVNGVFHHPTPILEELSIATQDTDSSGPEDHPIFVHPAPNLTRIMADANYPLDNMLNTNSAVKSLHLDFYSATENELPNYALLRNIKYLCISRLYSSRSPRESILLPSLEDLTLRETENLHFIKAPRLTTLRFFIKQKFLSDPVYIPYFPSLRKFHWLLYGEEDGKFESLQQYLDQHPLVEEIGFVYLDDKSMKDMLPRLKDALGGRKLAIKGYQQSQGLDQLWSWSPPFPYEFHEIDTSFS